MSISAMRQALEALEWNYGTDLENIENCTAWLDKLNATIPALRQAIEQAEKQEPVIGAKTWFEDGKMVTQHLYASDISQERVDETAKSEHEFECPRCGHCCRRDWVGLTEEEIADYWVAAFNENGLYVQTFASLIEAKLKEKNG